MRRCAAAVCDGVGDLRGHFRPNRLSVFIFYFIFSLRSLGPSARPIDNNNNNLYERRLILTSSDDCPCSLAVCTTLVRCVSAVNVRWLIEFGCQPEHLPFANEFSTSCFFVISCSFSARCRCVGCRHRLHMKMMSRGSDDRHFARHNFVCFSTCRFVFFSSFICVPYIVNVELLILINI